MLHALYAACRCYNTILVCIIHTDVIITVVALICTLIEVEVWVVYNNRKGFRKSTGATNISYIVACFCWDGKRSALRIRKALSQLTQIMIDLSTVLIHNKYKPCKLLRDSSSCSTRETAQQQTKSVFYWSKLTETLHRKNNVQLFPNKTNP